MAVNIDEGEPGTFKDRYFLENDPHRFLEGCLIACWAVGIEEIYLYLRDEYAACRILLLKELEALKNDPPEIVAFNVPRKGEAKKAMTFSAAAVDGDQPLLTYEWDMGDGKILTGKSVEYTYRSKAKYTVTLTVTDEMGACLLYTSPSPRD